MKGVKKEHLPVEDLRCMPAPFCLAQEVGEKLERCKILQRPLPE
jgi:hypothetical protein